MSKSVYISENITEEQQQLISYLSEKEIDYFRLHELRDSIGDQYSNFEEIVENLCQKHVLKRIERGHYASERFNDPYVFGTFVVKDSAIAYWSALNLHGLTDQFPATVFVQTTQRKKNKELFGVRYQFVTVHPRKLTGITLFGYGNYRYPITDPEKTILDCFDLPQYSGGFDILVNALAVAKLSPGKMINNAQVMKNIAAVKRVGYLLNLMKRIEMTQFIAYARSRVNPKYNLIDTGGSDTGEFVSEWKLRLNVSESDILGILSEIY